MEKPPSLETVDSNKSETRSPRPESRQPPPGIPQEGGLTVGTPRAARSGSLFGKAPHDHHVTRVQPRQAPSPGHRAWQQTCPLCKQLVHTLHRGQDAGPSSAQKGPYHYLPARFLRVWALDSARLPVRSPTGAVFPPGNQAYLLRLSVNPICL